jgi:hypothetical protein
VVAVFEDGPGVVGGAAARRDNERGDLRVSGAQRRRCERRIETSKIVRECRDGRSRERVDGDVN